MMQKHGVVLTLSADVQVAGIALFIMKFQARAPTVSAPAQSRHELGEWTLFDKELALAVAALEPCQLAAFSVLTFTFITIRFETIPLAAGAIGTAPLGSQFYELGLRSWHGSSV